MNTSKIKQVISKSYNYEKAIISLDDQKQQMEKNIQELQKS